SGPPQATRYASSSVGRPIRARGGVLQPLSNVSRNRGQDPLHASRLPVTAVGEEELRIAGGAEVEPLDPVDAGLPQQSFRRLPEIEASPARDSGSEARSVWGCDLLADLVAAGANRRPDRGGQVAGECRNAGLDDPFEKPDPAGVQDADGPRGSQRITRG